MASLCQAQMIFYLFQIFMVSISEVTSWFKMATGYQHYIRDLKSRKKRSGRRACFHHFKDFPRNIRQCSYINFLGENLAISSYLAARNSGEENQGFVSNEEEENGYWEANSYLCCA